MRCDAAERELSARLDREAGGRIDGHLEEHLATCPRCREFRARAGRLRELVRLEPAAPVPDLVPAIISKVRREAAGSRRPLRWPSLAPGWGRYAAAFVAGAVAAALVLAGLPGLQRGVAPALAVEIPNEISAASTEVSAYRATFDVMERHFHPRVPERRFEAEVWFRAPERFRAEVRDLTAYPAGAWPRNDLDLAVDRDRWLLRGPATCPRQALPVCWTSGTEVRRVVGREPFDSDTPLPTDIVLPVATLAGTDRVHVVGRDEILGHDVVVVELAYRDATPLFGYLQAAGSWRPLFPLDRVLVSLDSRSWFPLAYEVRAADSPDRNQWALRNFLPPERPGALLLRVRTRSFRPQVGRIPGLPQAPGAMDQGFRDLPLAELATATGDPPLLPEDLAGLRSYRAGTFAGPGRPGGETVLSFSRGLAWLKVRETRTWHGPDLFGDVTDLATPVSLGDGEVGYYEPATAALGRRLSIHAAGIDLYLESNLPRDTLLGVGASIPVRGRPIPQSWLVKRSPGATVRLQVPLPEARAAVPGLSLPRPDSLPDGYRLATIHLVQGAQGTGVAVYFRRPGTELDGVGIRYFQAPGDRLAPPMDPDVLRVRMDGASARYAPSRGLLEWTAAGTYRSLTAPTLDLATLLRMARGLEEA